MLDTAGQRILLGEVELNVGYSCGVQAAFAIMHSSEPYIKTLRYTEGNRGFLENTQKVLFGRFRGFPRKYSKSTPRDGRIL